MPDCQGNRWEPQRKPDTEEGKKQARLAQQSRGLSGYWCWQRIGVYWSVFEGQSVGRVSAAVSKLISRLKGQGNE